MFRLIFVFAALSIGLFVGTQYAGQQGYVLISMANHTIEMSVTTLVIFVITTLVGLFLLEFIIKRSVRATSATWNWFGIRKMRRARKLTNEGIIKLIEGDWKSAEKKVTRWSNSHDMPLLCYLIAAEAAHAQGNSRKCEQYLELASKQENSELSVGLTRAKQMITMGEHEKAFDLLSTLKNNFKQNPILLQLLKQCYIELKLWQPLLELLPELNNSKALNQKDFAALTAQAQSGRISEIATQQGVDGVIRHWDHLPKSVKHESKVIQAFARELIARDASNTAFTVLKEAISKTPDEELLNVIPQLNLSDWHPALALLKKLQKKHTDNASIHSALGQINMIEGHWSEAQSAFEAALKIRPNAYDYGQLANALHKQNYNNAANEVSQKALLLLSNNI
jgi:HemY protein